MTKEAGESIAAELKLKHEEVSAKTGKRVNELFENIIDIILDDRKK